MAKVVRHRRYVKTNTNNNNNKFWYITEYDDGSIMTEWGRIGEKGDSKVHEPGKKNFDSLCKSKERGKADEPPYQLLNVVDAPTDSKITSTPIAKNNIVDIAAKQIANGNVKIEQLIKYIAKQNIHNILSNTTMSYSDSTGLFSTPCGVVDQDNIKRARIMLDEMLPFIKSKLWTSEDYIRRLENYLMIIPQKVKNMRNTSDIFPDEDSLQKQSGILDSLQASLDSLKNNTKNDKQMEEKVFSVVLTELSDAVVYDRIKNMFKATSHQSHSCSHLKLSEVYEVDITTMRERFEQYGKPIGNIRQYWHGTRVANVLSILHKGLIIPPSSASHVCGRMFGDGLYFSDQSTKSLNYSYGYWDGRSKDNNCFMFLADVAMGKQYTPTNTYERLPRTGFDSTFAQAGKSGVNNNEMIVYNVNQCNLRYLCKFA